MTSIWDAPQASEQTTQTSSDKGSRNPVAPNVATLGGRERIYGTQTGPLLSSAGRGIVGGVPYGESDQQRVEALNAQYPFNPGFVARARAASRQALGR
jgi:hypothetical protein